MRRRFLKDKTSYDFSNYMTFEVLGDGFQFKISSRDVEYNCNGGGWEILSKGAYSPSFMVGDFVSVKCVLKRNEIFGIFDTNGIPFNLRGNALSLIYGDEIINNIEGYPYVFRYLFSTIMGLQHVEEGFLPATILSEGCYMGMFYNSTIMTAPELPAPTLVYKCYKGMYQVCENLNYIKMLATDISAQDCFDSWVIEVASTGTFVKNPAMTTLPTATSYNRHAGIPEGWTVINDGEESGGGNLITFTIDGTEYQAEEGMTWSEWVGSEYNVINASTYLQSNNVALITVGVQQGLPVILYDSNGGSVFATQKIITNNNYTAQTIGGGGGS